MRAISRRVRADVQSGTQYLPASQVETPHQAKLAETLCVEPDYIGRIERGKENLTLRSMSRIADALGVDPSDLVRRAEVEKK